MDKVLGKGTIERQRIIVVDEEHELLSPLTVQLEHAGFSVSKARRGAEAMKLIKEAGADLVIINPTLTDMNGFKLAVQIKENWNVPFVFLSDKLSEEFREAALAVGALQYLSKSSRPDENVTQIRLAIRTLSEHTASLEKKLDSTKKRQSMVSIFVELWQADEKDVRDTITLFARKKRISLDTLAEVHQKYRISMMQLRAKHASEMQSIEAAHKNEIKEIEPELIGELSEFFKEVRNQRLETNGRQLEFGINNEARSANS
jgi:DNA-binding response OmpR family regulator